MNGGAMNFQRTIGKEVTISGISLHLGSESRLTFKPAPPDSGVVFVRTDLPGSPWIRANITHAIGGVVRRTSVGDQEVRVHTVEHVMAALAGLRIDNVIIETNAPEPPAMDGSALPFVRIMKDAGIVDQDSPRRDLQFTEALSVTDGDKELIMIPDGSCRITYVFKSDAPILLMQLVSLELTEDSFATKIAPARTFCFQHEVEALKAQGLGKGGSSDNVVVIGNDGKPDHEPRLEDEMARHKILDLIGDLYLLGGIPDGHIIGVRSGHDLNAQLIQKIAESHQKNRRMSNAATMEVLGVNEIKRILPHRYPFLLVDRVIEWEEGKMAVGIKNVTINEEFFQGHFPQEPIMPGMLQIEALAQLAGILVSRSKEEDDSIGMFRSVEKVKFRRTVRPGDQLRLEVHVLRKRSNIARFSGQAFVDGEVVAEAEFTIAL
jgi:UDP-3-O-[3-hydroxymyristoyl] N-acetylglucosamine deacetylase/3-hydroxyacyl-[acyl-carrier-protein] dehydratase